MLINGLNDGTTSLKFLLCTEAKIGFHTTTRKVSPLKYAMNILNGIQSNEDKVNQEMSFLFITRHVTLLIKDLLDL